MSVCVIDTETVLMSIIARDSERGWMESYGEVCMRRMKKENLKNKPASVKIMNMNVTTWLIFSYIPLNCIENILYTKSVAPPEHIV